MSGMWKRGYFFGLWFWFNLDLDLDLDFGHVLGIGNEHESVTMYLMIEQEELESREQIDFRNQYQICKSTKLVHEEHLFHLSPTLCVKN